MSDEQERARLAAIRELEAGDLLEAQKRLAATLSAPLLASARAHLLAGEPAQALAESGRAKEVAPSLPEVLLLRGEACLQVGAQLAHDDLKREALLQEAHLSFLDAGDSPRALLGRSRAARALGRSQEARECALAAHAALDAGAGGMEGAPSGELPETPMRTLAEAHVLALAEARAGGQAVDPARTSEALEVLGALIRDEPRDPWGWREFAGLELEGGRPGDARATLERALQELPLEESLHALLGQAAARAGGSSDLMASYGRLQARHPKLGILWWYPAAARLEAALTRAPADLPRELRIAQADFKRCRSLDPQRTEACLRMEAACQGAAAFEHLANGRLEPARKAFLELERIRPGGARLQLHPRLRTGVAGMVLLAEAFASRDELGPAAEVYAELHRLEPRDFGFAASAAAFLRDSGARLEAIASDFAQARKGRLREPQRLKELRAMLEVEPSLYGTEREKDLFFDARRDHLQRARRNYERSYEAYLDALALAPRDVRLLADAGQVAVAHLRIGDESVAGLLTRAVELGAEQTVEASASGPARTTLLTAWGDAHQTLGRLHLELRKDPALARTWFLRAAEIGPLPRPEIEQVYLPRCEAALTGPGGR